MHLHPSLYFLHAASLLHLVSCPSFRPPTHVVLSCTPFPLFISFFRTTSLRRRCFASQPGAECDTRRSLVNVQEVRLTEKCCIWHCVVNRITFPSTYAKKAARVLIRSQLTPNITFTLFEDTFD